MKSSPVNKNIHVQDMVSCKAVYVEHDVNVTSVLNLNLLSIKRQIEILFILLLYKAFYLKLPNIISGEPNNASFVKKNRYSNYK